VNFAISKYRLLENTQEELEETVEMEGTEPALDVHVMKEFFAYGDNMKFKKPYIKNFLFKIERNRTKRYLNCLNFTKMVK